MHKRARWIFGPIIAAFTIVAVFAGAASGNIDISSQSNVVAVVAPDHVTQTVLGCRNNGTITLPNGSGQFVCPDAAYTGGNLGKGWNELDLVPFRLITNTGNASPATQTYDTGVAFDSLDGGKPGYDVIGTIVLNTAESAASCKLNSQSGQTDITPGFGGIDKSIGRTLNITQLKNTTCVFDYYGRLALGSHLFPGSSLHGNLSDGSLSGSNQDVPIPVKEILPQSIAKDMAATTSQDQPWNIEKSPTPAHVSFGDVCAPGFANTQPVQVTVTWTKLAPTPSGQVTLVTHVIATNPAARTITITPTDTMYEGSTQTTQVGTTLVGAAVDVPANTTETILTDMQVVSSSATSFNDVATATYIDKVTGVPVPGQTQATASANSQITSTTNGAATASDSEQISGSGLSFAVAAPSSGAFTGGYTAGSFVAPGPVGWSSGLNAITGNGSITFDKTIKLNPAVSTSGDLTDQATITGSDGSVVKSALLDIGIDSSASSTLTVNKTIPNVLQGSETAFFVFDLIQNGNVVATQNASFVAGETTKQIQFTGVAPGQYSVHETASSEWTAQPDQAVDLTGCSNSVTFHNDFPKATAFASKTTDPVGFQGNWVLSLNGPGGPVAMATDPSGQVDFGNLAEGSYSITEAVKPGWSEVGAVAQGSGTVTGGDGAGAKCVFTVDYPADGGKTFGCAFTNKARVGVALQKSFEGGALRAGQDFGFQLREHSSINLLGNLIEAGDATLGDGGLIQFAAQLVPGTSYAICEVLTPGENPDFGIGISTYHPNGDPTLLCRDIFPSILDAGQVETFAVDNTPTPAVAQVAKVTDPAGGEAGWLMTLNGPGVPAGGETVTTTGSGPIPFTTVLQDGGSYTVTETSKPGWTQINASSDCSFTVSYPADAGRTFSCTITNRTRARIIVTKQTIPAGSSQSFAFSTSGTGYAQFNLTDGQSNDSGELLPGGYAVAETPVTGWVTTSATCDQGNTPDHITLNPGDTIHCLFVNTQQAKIIVKKVTKPAGSSQAFTFTPGNWDGGSTFNLTDGTQHASGDLAPGGGYSVSEAAVSGWDNVSATCDGSGNTPASITLAPGQTVTCIFTNVQRGHIIVNKVTDPSPDPSSSTFHFPTTGAGYAAFDLQNGGSNDSGGLVPGNYSVSEAALAGWSLKSATCDSGTIGALVLAPGQTIHCTFTNISRGHLRLVKTLNGGALGTQTFDFTLRSGASQASAGMILDSGTASAANGGVINFAFGLVPGQIYQVCETVVPTYGPNFTGGFGPFNPLDDPGFYCENIGPITVAQAANNPSLTLNVDNSHQFVKALTIGYWKTHAPASCKQGTGKQADALTPALGSGFSLGTSYQLVSACVAVNLLSKSNIAGVKQPGDPIFNMVAQLVGAKLNVASGATCPAAATAIAGAESLLSTIHFNGLTYDKPLSAANAALANGYNTSLDSFNNNNLC